MADGSADGRPVGTLAAWLADSSKVHTREEHRSPFYIMCLPLENRQHFRNVVKAHPNGPAMLRHERKQEDGEPEEPLDVPMGW